MANIKLNNNAYSISDSVLAPVTADFIAHLGTIAGEGLKIVVDGIEYSVDPTKLNNASASLEAVFSALSGGNEPETPSVITWDGVVGDRATKVMGSEFTMVKVSDAILHKEDFVGAELTMNNGTTVGLTDDMVFISPDGLCTYTVENMVISMSETTFYDEYSGEVTFPETGTYFAYLPNQGMYISSLTLPNSN